MKEKPFYLRLLVFPESFIFFIIYRLQEKHTREKLHDHLKSMVTAQEELKEVLEKINDIETRIKMANQRQERLVQPGTR